MATLISTSIVLCLRDFNDFINYIKELDEENLQEIRLSSWQDELGRLRIWAANIGAHQTGQASLDYRLRDSSHIRQQIIKLLESILERLQDARDIITDEEDEDVESLNDGSCEGEEAQGEFGQILGNIGSTIGCLFEMSILVRKPARHDLHIGSKKVDVAAFEPFDRQHVAAKYPKADQTLIVRLGQAITRRRKYLKYRERHAAKLKQGIGKVTNIVHDDNATATEVLSETIATDAQQWNVNFDDKASESDMSQTSYGSTLKSGGAITIPAPPRASQDGKSFECPYCYFIITIQSTRSWNKHVFDDLQPYVCTNTTCITPDKLYTTRHEWLHHLQSEHPNEESAEVKEKDPDAMRMCSLCKELQTTGHKYDQHMARHLQELALFVLPRNEEYSDGDDPSSDLDSGPSRAQSSGDQNRDGTGDDSPLAKNSEAEELNAQEIKCFCGYYIDDGNMVFCERCETWQHLECYYDHNNPPPNLEDMVHLCVDCEPRQYDAKAARERQRARRTSKLSSDEEGHLQPRQMQNDLTTSYWSRPEQTDFPGLLRRFGSNWQAIAEHLKTKTPVMVKNYYYRRIEAGAGELEISVKLANEEIRGKDLGPPRSPTKHVSRRNDPGPQLVPSRLPEPSIEVNDPGANSTTSESPSRSMATDDSKEGNFDLHSPRNFVDDETPGRIPPEQQAAQQSLSTEGNTYTKSTNKGQEKDRSEEVLSTEDLAAKARATLSAAGYDDASIDQLIHRPKPKKTKEEEDLEQIESFAAYMQGPYLKGYAKGHATDVRRMEAQHIAVDDENPHVKAERASSPHNETFNLSRTDTSHPDFLVMQCGGNKHLLRFPTSSIADGILTVGEVRREAARSLGCEDYRRFLLMYKARSLADDSRSCKSEGLKQGSTLLGIVSNNTSTSGTGPEGTSATLARKVGEADDSTLARTFSDAHKLAAESHICPRCSDEFPTDLKLWEHARTRHADDSGLADTDDEQDARKEGGSKQSRRIMRWSSEEEQILKQARERGESFEDIASFLGRSVIACRVKHARLTYRARGDSASDPEESGEVSDGTS